MSSESPNRQGSDSTVQGVTTLRARPLAPSLKKPEKAKQFENRGAPPVLSTRGMGDQESWNASDWIQNAKIEMWVLRRATPSRTHLLLLSFMKALIRQPPNLPVGPKDSFLHLLTLHIHLSCVSQQC